jgi:predicted metalloprotease with PDZ domain
MTALVNAKMNTPGAQLYTPIENSQRAVFADAGVSIDATNYTNMFTTYYYYGGALALALDLELRNRFNKSLDDVMEVLWKKHGKKEISYTLTDVQAALATASGNAAYAATFFKKYVYNHDSIDYGKLLSAAGYTLTQIEKGKAWIGRAFLDSTGNGMVIKTNTVRSSPLYLAAADIGDTLVELDGRKTNSTNDINDIISTHKPGDTLPLIYIHRNNMVKGKIELQEDPTVEIENIDKQANSINITQQQFRAKWLEKGK